MNKKDRYELYRYSVGPGWWGILDRYVPQLMERNPECSLYIKEKYGLLRIYMTGKLIDREAFEKAADAAELESVTVCECCGSPGLLRENLVWMLTLCDHCLEANSEQKCRIEAEAEQRWLDTALEDI